MGGVECDLVWLGWMWVDEVFVKVVEFDDCVELCVDDLVKCLGCVVVCCIEIDVCVLVVDGGNVEGSYGGIWLKREMCEMLCEMIDVWLLCVFVVCVVFWFGKLMWMICFVLGELVDLLRLFWCDLCVWYYVGVLWVGVLVGIVLVICYFENWKSGVSVLLDCC